MYNVVAAVYYKMSTHIIQLCLKAIYIYVCIQVYSL